MTRCLPAFVLLSLFPSILLAQLPPESASPAPAPVITGAAGFLSDLGKGQQTFGPKIEPVLLVPLGDRFLIETEYSTDTPVERANGILGPAVFSHSFEYAQLDYSATSFLTVVAGYFVTPFGIYKERIDPLWIRNFLDEPLLTPINDNSSDGLMLRGAIAITPSLEVKYETSLSANVTNQQFASAHQTSTRLAIFLPEQRLEIGASYGHIFGAEGYDLHGLDFSWKAKGLPLDIRGEGLWSRQVGSGYWLEAAYRFPASANSFLRQSQAIFRGEQFFSTAQTAGFNPDLPSQSTHRVSVGWNYWVRDFLRFTVAYAHRADSVPRSVTTFGIVYFFNQPLGRS